MKIYISGKITDNPDYLQQFAAAELHLLSCHGNAVINPAKLLSVLPEDTEYKVYMEASIILLKQCNAIYMLDNWKDSPGACAEYLYAVEHNYFIILGPKL